MFSSKDTKEEQKRLKEEEKLKEILEKYRMSGLMTPENEYSMRNIARELSGVDIGRLGVAISNKDITETLKLNYLSVIMEQNFMIIRILNEVLKTKVL